MDMGRYKSSNKKGVRYIIVILGNFSSYTRCILLKYKYGWTIIDELSISLTSSKQNPIERQGERGAEFFNSVFWNFLKFNNLHHFSTFWGKGPSIAEKLNKMIGDFLKELDFEEGNASWRTELPSAVENYNKTIYRSTKMTRIQTSEKVNRKTVFSNHQDKRGKPVPEQNLGDLVRLDNIKKFFNKGDKTN